ncbi:MAG: phosphate ABC transporter substrate-binding protein PstS [Austwickia sp.]|nr:phosphate ABC transporter substrate-binding protein PstS [Austwickia sp.]MBK8435062.1 phosphate ABC transporter substrate-binding protein PstS [Austwickia sp.]
MLASPDNGIPALRTDAARRRRVVMPLVVIAVVALVVLLLTAASARTDLRGSGSTLAQPLIERAAGAYRAAQTADVPEPSSLTPGPWQHGSAASIDYEPVGSLGGIMRLTRGQVDFAVSDYPLSAQALQQHSVVQFPIAVGAVAVAHNLTLPAGKALRLDASSLAGIYTGRITSWDDPALRALNPALALPRTPITAVHRREGSGSTFGFTSYLATGGREWADGPGVGSVITWPAGRAADRSSGLIETVKSVPGAVGYVEPGQARRAGLQVAQLRNAAGTFVAPEGNTLRAALSGMDFSGAEQYARPLTAPNSPSAYPATVLVYALVPRDGDARQTRAVLSYFAFVIDRYDADAAGLGYLPLPAHASRAVQDYWSTTYADLT